MDTSVGFGRFEVPLVGGVDAESVLRKFAKRTHSSITLNCLPVHSLIYIQSCEFDNIDPIPCEAHTVEHLHKFWNLCEYQNLSEPHLWQLIEILYKWLHCREIEYLRTIPFTMVEIKLLEFHMDFIAGDRTVLPGYEFLCDPLYGLIKLDRTLVSSLCSLRELPKDGLDVGCVRSTNTVNIIPPIYTKHPEKQVGVEYHKIRGTIVAGGSVLTTLRRYAYKIPTTLNRLVTASDIDIFTYADHDEALKEFLNVGIPSRAPIVSVTSNSIQIGLQQFVTKKYNSIWQILHGFDIDCCCICIDPITGDTYASRRWMHSFEHNYNVLDISKGSSSYDFRLRKYMKRGMGVYVPELDKYKRIRERPIASLSEVLRRCQADKHHVIKRGDTDVAINIGHELRVIMERYFTHISRQLRGIDVLLIKSSVDKIAGYGEGFDRSSIVVDHYPFASFTTEDGSFVGFTVVADTTNQRNCDQLISTGFDVYKQKPFGWAGKIPRRLKYANVGEWINGRCYGELTPSTSSQFDILNTATNSLELMTAMLQHMGYARLDLLEKYPTEENLLSTFARHRKVNRVKKLCVACSNLNIKPSLMGGHTHYTDSDISLRIEHAYDVTHCTCVPCVYYNEFDAKPQKCKCK